MPSPIEFIHLPELKTIRVISTTAKPPRVTLEFLSALSELRTKIYNTECKYVVFESWYQGVFNLGGDLDLFIECIADGDRASLMHYAMKCVDMVHDINTGFGSGVMSFAAIEGDALGGGFEGALACQFIVASHSALIGFPEPKFGMFPGMGGVSFASRRVGEQKAIAMCTEGHMSRVGAIGDGLVDLVCRPGKALTTALTTIVTIDSIDNPAQVHSLKLRQMRSIVPKQELIDCATYWVDAAMFAKSKWIKRMARFRKAQRNLGGEK